MKVFLSAEWIAKRLTEQLRRSNLLREAERKGLLREGRITVKPSSGYGTALRQFKRLCADQGWELTLNPAEADLEIYSGPPWEKRRPHLRPSIIFTNVEFEGMFTREEVQAVNEYDVVMTPSRFCVEALRRQGVHRPIFYTPHWIETEKFKLVERDWNGPFNVLCQASVLFDRKNAWCLVDFFIRYRSKLPSDMHFTVKTTESHRETDVLVDRMRIVQADLKLEEYLKLMASSLLSVYPSTGGGFGLMPGEHASTGMAVAIAKNSALKTEYFDQVESAFFEIPMRYGSSPLNPLRTSIPDYEGLFDLLMRLYEDRTTLQEHAKLASDFVRTQMTYERRKDFFLNAIDYTLRSVDREQLDELDSVFDYYLGEFKLQQMEAAKLCGIRF